MSRDKLIEELVIDLDEIYSTDFIGDYAGGLRDIAERLADKGYRKASEVIDEVVELLEELKDDYCLDEDIRAACGVRYAMIKVDELKNKYTEGK